MSTFFIPHQYSDWLILQRATRSENSAYSSSVKRVLITRRRCGVLYFFMGFNSFRGWIFSSGASRKRRAWGGNPNKIPAGQIERLAKFGTVVESCSKKVTASAVWAFADTLDGEGGASANFAAVFLSLLPTTPRKAKMTEICGNFPLFLTKPHKSE